MLANAQPNTTITLPPVPAHQLNQPIQLQNLQLQANMQQVCIRN